MINTALLTDYAFILKPGGLIYTVTDVEDLHTWETSKLNEHPMFERIDPQKTLSSCEKIMRTGTEEGQRVEKKGGKVWHSVYRKRDLREENDDMRCGE